MRRLPRGRLAAIRPFRYRVHARERSNSAAARFRWIIVLGAFFALVGAGLTIGLDQKQAAVSAAKAANASIAPLVGSSVLSQSDLAEDPSPEAKLPTSPPKPSPTHTPARAPAPASTVPPAPAPTATAENQTPRGANELAWSEAILTALGDPLTDANIVSMGYWMQNEAGSPPKGIVGANNPINVSQPGYGGWPIKSEGGGWSLYSYPTPQDGVAATVKYLTPTGYPLILAVLKSGQGLSSSSLAGELSVYSGGGYRQIPDTWGASQGRPDT
jgi:hypothetical protein